MHELYPDKSKGDKLGAGHINRINDACRQVMGGFRGQYNSQSHGVPIGMPGHVEWVVEITRVVDASIGLYDCLPRYSLGGNNWQTDTDDEGGPYVLDISPTWKEQTTEAFAPYETSRVLRPTSALRVGDRVIAFWHLQREAFVATYLIIDGFIEFTLLSDIESQKAKARIDYWWGRDPVDDPDTDESSENNSPDRVMVYDTTDNFRRGLKDAKGLAIWNPVRRQYIIVVCQSKAGTIQGTMKTGLGVSSGSGGGITSSGGTSMGSSPGSGTEGSGSTTVIRGEAEITSYYGTQGDIQDPQGKYDSPEGRPKIIVYDPLGLFKRALTGAKFKAILDVISDRYNLVECQTKAGFVQFTTRAARRERTSGGECGTLADSWEVEVTRYWGTQQDIQNPCPGGERLLVYDFIGHFPWPSDGGKGLAVLDVEQDKYIVTSCTQRAFMGSGTLPYDFPEDHSYFNAQLSPNTPPPFDGEIGKVDIYNVHGWAGVAGQSFDAKWNQTLCRWEMSQVTC